MRVKGERAAPQSRDRIELRHRHRVFPNFETWLQRAACGDLTAVIERQANDLKHATILAWDWLPVRYTSSVAGI